MQISKFTAIDIWTISIQGASDMGCLYRVCYSCCDAVYGHGSPNMFPGSDAVSLQSGLQGFCMFVSD